MTSPGRHYRPTPIAQTWAAEAVTEPIPVVNALGVGMNFSSEPERRPWRHDGTGRHRAAVAAAATAAATGRGRHRAAGPTTGGSVARIAVWTAALGVLGFGAYAYTADQVLGPADYPSVSAPVSDYAPVPVQVPTDSPTTGHGGGHGVPYPVPSTTDPTPDPSTERECDQS